MGTTRHTGVCSGRAPVKQPKRVRVEISFELERDMLPSRTELDAAFHGATDGVLKEKEFFYVGKMGAHFVRKAKG